MSTGTKVMWMRGGTSKGGYFLADDLPSDPVTRDALLLRIMGSPDPRQIDGMGGADPLTSKVAVVRKSKRKGVDVDYLFLQVFVDRALVSDAQNCGNILAGVGPFAIERGLIDATDSTTDIRIYMENTGQIAVATVATPDSKVTYQGTAEIDGVPGSAAPIPIVFQDTAGSSCGALLPTGNNFDFIDDHAVTLIDNGMPCVILNAAEFGLTGDETPEELDANDTLKSQLESIRLQAGLLMNLGDVSDKTIPKMTLVSPSNSGTISTRTFIPHKCHKAIGVLGAVSVGTACLLPDGPASAIAHIPTDTPVNLSIEHPSGAFIVVVHLDNLGNVTQAGVLRSARKLMDGIIFSL